MIKISIIGIGNAGSQIAMLAKKSKEFPAIAINSSERDIDSVKGYIESIIFGDHEGAGKDRSIAKRFVAENAAQMLGEEPLIDMINQTDYIFIVSSAAGGTGSGSAPIITDILNQYYNSKLKKNEKGKVFINIGILPSLGESVGAQRNTAEYLAEMSALGGSFMLFDNDRVKGTPNKVFDTINRSVVDTLCLIRGDYSINSAFGMIDEKDMWKLVSQPGLIFVDILKEIYEEKIPENGSVEDMIIEHINKHSCMVKIDRDRIVKRLGYIGTLSEDVHSYFDENLPKIRATYGEPIEDFRHFTVNEDDTESNMIAIVMSGMSIPENRLKTIKHRIDDAEAALSKQKSGSLLSGIIDSVQKYDSTSEKKALRQHSDFNLESIVGKY